MDLTEAIRIILPILEPTLDAINVEDVGLTEEQAAEALAVLRQAAGKINVPLEEEDIPETEPRTLTLTVDASDLWVYYKNGNTDGDWEDEVYSIDYNDDGTYTVVVDDDD